MKLAQKHNAKYIDVNAPLTDRDGNLKAEYTIEGMHINRDGYLSILDDVLKQLTNQILVNLLIFVLPVVTDGNNSFFGGNGYGDADQIYSLIFCG